MGEYTLPITRVRAIAEHTQAIWVDISDTYYDFKPGQSATVELRDPPYTDADGNVRRFSICNAPNQDVLLFATRIRESAFKRSFAALREGDTVIVEDAEGMFTLHKDSNKPAVFIAGGIGITPFRSMIEYVQQEETGHEIYMVYSNKTPEQAAFLQELQRANAHNEDFHVIATMTRPEASEKDWHGVTGRVDADMLREQLPQSVLEHGMFYIAGPPQMVEALAQVLVEMDEIDDTRIRAEQFSGY